MTEEEREAIIEELAYKIQYLMHTQGIEKLVAGPLGNDVVNKLEQLNQFIVI